MPRSETNERRRRRLEIEERRAEEKRRVWHVSLANGRTIIVSVDVSLSKTGCCHEMASDVTITVDNSRTWDAKVYNSCSQWPVCGSPNNHCWREDGHYFELTVDGTALHVWKEALALFVDGVEVESGRAWVQYWRRQFLKKLLAAALVLAVGCVGLFVYVGTGKTLATMSVLLIPFALVLALLAVVGMVRVAGERERAVFGDDETMLPGKQDDEDTERLLV